MGSFFFLTLNIEIFPYLTSDRIRQFVHSVFPFWTAALNGNPVEPKSHQPAFLHSRFIIITLQNHNFKFWVLIFAGKHLGKGTFGQVKLGQHTLTGEKVSRKSD